jgi:hypothetical protein
LRVGLLRSRRVGLGSRATRRGTLAPLLLAFGLVDLRLVDETELQ